MSDIDAKTNGRALHETGSEVVLVTGFPSYIAKRLITKIVAANHESRVVMLAREKFAAAAREFIDAMPPALAGRVEIAVGDICDMDLGLAGGEYRALTDRVTSIHHLAAIYHLGVPKDQAQRVNVQGTRTVLEFAGGCRQLRRLCHYSTASVSGKRQGVIMETELDEGQSFRNAYEETKLAAERLVRAELGRLPITILRPGIIVGDSRSGEIDKFDGPYYLMVLIVTSPLDVHLPLPGKGSAPLHLVPVQLRDRRRARPVARRPRGRQDLPPDGSGAAGRAHGLRGHRRARPQEVAARVDPFGDRQGAAQGAGAGRESRARRWPSWSRSTTSRSTTAATRWSSCATRGSIARRSSLTWTTSSPTSERSTRSASRSSKTRSLILSTRDGAPRWPTGCAGAGRSVG